MNRRLQPKGWGRCLEHTAQKHALTASLRERVRMGDVHGLTPQGARSNAGVDLNRQVTHSKDKSGPLYSS